jgi:hypothetical protein
MMPYRQAENVLAEFLPVEPTETHATVRKRTVRIGERLDDQIAEDELCARSQSDERDQLEMQLPGDRRKEFIISIDTAHVRSADPNSARNFELVVQKLQQHEAWITRLRSGALIWAIWLLGNPQRLGQQALRSRRWRPTKRPTCSKR